MKLTVAVFASFVLLLSGRAMAAGADPVPVSIHCNCEDTEGQSYLKAVTTAMSQHPEYRMVSETTAGEVVRVEITSHAVVADDGTKQTKITVVSRYAGATATDSFQRSCNWLQLSDVAEATIAGLHDLL